MTLLVGHMTTSKPISQISNLYNREIWWHSQYDVGIEDIRAELRGHLDDHVSALLATGYIMRSAIRSRAILSHRIPTKCYQECST
jgi:hypothetical protein